MQLFFVVIFILGHYLEVNGALNESVQSLLEILMDNTSDYQMSVVFSQTKPKNGSELIEVEAVGLNIYDETFNNVFNIFANANPNDLELNDAKNDNGAIAYFISNLEETHFIEHLVNSAIKQANMKFHCYTGEILSHVITTNVHIDKIAEIKLNRIKNINIETQRYIFKVTRYAFLTFRNVKYILSIIKDMLNADFKQYKWNVITLKKFNNGEIHSHNLMEFAIEDTKLKIFGYKST